MEKKVKSESKKYEEEGGLWKLKQAIENKWGDMKFDIVVGNPPYGGNLHLDIIESVLPFMSGRATWCFIHPATWLINVRKNGKAKKYDVLKKKLEGHIKSIEIENLNKDFKTGLYVPFSTTTIDMSKTFDNIDCAICGEHKIVTSIYDCNLIGNYEIIWNILDKVQNYGDMMKNHITKEDKGREYWYSKYSEIISLGGCAATTSAVGYKYDSDNVWEKVSNGNYCTSFITTSYHTFGNNISNTPLCAYDRGHHLTDKITDNIYGTKEELENWKHFIFNNKLPLFINIVLTIDQNNNSKDFLPWLVDKQYTDDEINKLFNFTDEEKKLIDDTLKKFERNSPWFKRYMCGKEDQNNVTTMEDSPKKKKKETPVNPQPSPSTSNSLPKSFYNLDREKLDPSSDIPEDEKYDEEDLKKAYNKYYYEV